TTPRGDGSCRAVLDDHASPSSYINAICDVLDGQPTGLSKEQIISDVLERRSELWPSRPVETVKRGLGVAFSTEPKSKIPRIWEWESVESAGRTEKIWKKSAPQDQHEHDSYGNHRSTVNYASSYTSPGQSIVVRARGDRATEGRQASSEILSTHIESPRPSTTGHPSMSAHLWRAGAAGGVESAQSTATSGGGSDATSAPTCMADDTQVGDGAGGDPRTTSADPDVRTNADPLSSGMSLVPSQPGVPQVSSTDDEGDSASNLQLLYWGRQIKRRKDLVPELRSLRERSSLAAEQAREIRQSQEQNSARISELEQQLQNVRKSASELAEQREASNLEQMDISVVIGNMEGEIEKIDQELLQS
ncbi:hypothetical protein LTR86_011186, partial [Recurvomyces mirabilis]